MDEKNTELHGAVAMYGPCTVRDLKVGETKYWCRCGLSKNQPWCDGSHKDTGIKPLKWTVDKSQTLFFICACKQTKSPPYCDGNHVNAPAEVENRKKNCSRVDNHVEQCKLCTNCGWVPDF
ncbi:CDGSH iron-sulfur domain-containing protein 3, mitochondrial-like [Ruditapes philippinarum]|uniref:CDGSH iron-sulfur domain-containing protein 3, mitochondrial-like n=1 Tax=Ruditapes philippinarum TaxID=129788 RepID=UPI00295BA91A|nr:CDGSH iron-sulfur domain-containing protein 3, mitochondrial-like [Ruditapes philippinarum]